MWSALTDKVLIPFLIVAVWLLLRRPQLGLEKTSAENAAHQVKDAPRCRPVGSVRDSPPHGQRRPYAGAAASPAILLSLARALTDSWEKPQGRIRFPLNAVGRRGLEPHDAKREKVD